MSNVKRCEALLRASLPHIAFDGWTFRSLEQGAQDMGMDPRLVHTLVSDPLGDLLPLYHQLCDRALLEEEIPLTSLKVPEKIETLLVRRLHMMAPDKAALKRAAPRCSLITSMVYSMAHTLWVKAGDHPTDGSFYSKRLTLSAICGVSFLFWLQDTSENARATQLFVHRRLDDLTLVFSARRRLCTHTEQRLQAVFGHHLKPQ